MSHDVRSDPTSVQGHKERIKGGEQWGIDSQSREHIAGNGRNAVMRTGKKRKTTNDRFSQVSYQKISYKQGTKTKRGIVCCRRAMEEWI